MKEQLALLPQLLTAHLQLSLVALLAGAFISLPLGIWVARNPRREAIVLGVASIVQTIPSLALLAVMVPALAALSRVTMHVWGVEFSNIGFLPALVALMLYSVLPMLRNVVTGLAGVDQALIEAAQGVGMTSWQQLWRVELPQAVPMIVAGIRTATTWVVGMTVLSTPVGAPSLGNYIFTGLQTRNFAAVVVGCVASAGLAMVLDLAIQAVEVGGKRGQRTRLYVALAAFALLYGYVGKTLYAAHHSDGRRAIRVGAKTFTEQYILAEVVAQHLKARGVAQDVEVVQSLGSTVAYDALKSGAIDIYVEYAGTVWTTLMKREERAPRTSVQAEVREFLAQQGEVSIAAILGFENSYTLAMRQTEVNRRGIVDMAALAKSSPSLRIAGDYEFFARPEWRGLQSTYGLHFAEERSMDPSLMYEAIEDHAVDVVAAYTTDGRIDAQGLVILADVAGVIPPYDALVLAGPSLRTRQPVLRALGELAGKITLRDMQRMNQAVDHDRQSPAEVAKKWLQTLR